MSMRAIVGCVGGGKSYYLTRCIVEALTERARDGSYRNRNVVTNVDLKPPENWHRYMSARHPEWYAQAELDHRLTVIDDDQLGEFWRYRGRDQDGEQIVLPSPTKEEYELEKPDWQDWASRDNGVHFILDEVGRTFNARNWQATHDKRFMVFEYSTLHRHLSDDITWAAQVFKQVDSQWRNLASEFIYMRNRSFERIGAFRNYGGCKVYATSEPVLGGKPASQDAMLWTDTFKIDPSGIGDLYHTSKYGKDADTNRKAKGLPMGVLWGGAIAAVLALAALLWVGPGMLTNSMASALDSEGEEIDQVEPVGSGVVVPAVPSHPVSPPAPPAVSHLTDDGEGKRVARLLDVQHAIPEQLVTDLSQSFGVTAAPGLRPGSVFIGGDREAVDQVAAMVTLADAGEPSPVVYVSAVLATVRLEDGEEFSLDWVLETAGAGASPNVNFVSALARALDDAGTFAIGANEFSAVVNAAAKSERFTVVSRPFLAVQSGETGRLASGREIPITDVVRNAAAVTTTTQFKEAELSFEMTPTVLGDGSISLTLDQENKDVLGQFGDTQTPALATQSFETTLRLQAGAVVALGGVAIDQQQSERRYPTRFRIPVLRSKGSGQLRQEFVLLARVSLEPPSMSGRLQPSLDAAIPQLHSEWDRTRRLRDRVIEARERAILRRASRGSAGAETSSASDRKRASPRTIGKGWR